MKLTEETLEQELSIILKRELNADIISQPREGKSKPDLILQFNDMRIVLELKVGRDSRMIQAVAQNYGYFTKLEMDGMLTVLFPDSVRRAITLSTDVLDIINNTNMSSIYLAPKQSKYFESTSIYSLIDWLKFSAKPKVVEVDLNLLTRVLTDAVEVISLELKRSKGIKNPALENVINRFELFSALSSQDEADDSTKKNDVTSVACDIASYVFVNQVLLYSLLSKPLNLPILSIIEKSSDLIPYFARVMQIDYRAVFNLEVANHLPNSALTPVNQIIYSLHNISFETIPHGLLGRLFHDFLPFETRKQLATFYTKPVAAEMLAVLAITNPRAIVLDAACGRAAIKSVLTD